jgi:nitrate reductase NapE component
MKSSTLVGMDLDSCDSFRRALLWYRFKRNAIRIWPIICIAVIGFGAYGLADNFSHSREVVVRAKPAARSVNYEQLGPYRIVAGS